MSSPVFELKILRQHWIKDDGAEDRTDLCSHGEVYIRIGSEILSNKESGSWSLSTAALFLMRTIGQNWEPHEYSNFLVPCCGHSIYPIQEGEDLVLIQGCQAGVDWKVNHTGSTVELETEKGTKVALPIGRYKEVVLAFADEVERFYGNPEDKIAPDDSFDAEGFSKFWQEWRALKNKWA